MPSNITVFLESIAPDEGRQQKQHQDERKKVNLPLQSRDSAEQDILPHC